MGVLDIPARPRGYGVLASGNYYFPWSSMSVGTSAALGNGTLRVAPWWVPNACTLSRIGAEVTVVGDAGSTVRLGIYADSGQGVPGARVLDAGTIAGDSATVQEITISQALTPGLYWIGAAVQGVTTTQPTVRTGLNTPQQNVYAGPTIPAAGAAIGSAVMTGVTGALPANFAAVPSAPSAGIPRLFVKVA